MRKIIFIGAGGYAKSVLDSLDSAQYEFCGFIDNFKPIGSTHLGFPILANSIHDFPERNDFRYFIAIGDNNTRLEKLRTLVSLNCQFINVIDKSAHISRFAKIGNGVYIGKLVVINGDCSVGDNCVVNSKALIEHGCKIADHCNISTNATINGDVRIGERSFIGSSSVFNGQIEIGENVTVGSGAVVVRSVPDNVVIAGIPAKILRKKDV